MSTLELREIRKSYGTLETLKGINLNLESGEFLVLLGASGCGKSTLLSMISGLSDPTSGDITLNERRLNGVHPKDRDIAMVFQSYALYPNLSVARNIGFGLEMRGIDRSTREKAVLEAAKVLQVDHLLDRKPGDLSGGQRQRVAIGRALVRKPKLFLFDEPLSNLDAKLRLEMRSELKRLHQMLGVTVVYVTHDQIEAMTLASRIAVMRGGCIEQLGTPEEIYNRPASRFVAEFMGSPPINILATQQTERGLEIASGAAVLKDLRPTDPVVVGIRPEAMKTQAFDGAITLSGTVDLVELTGPEQIVSVALRDTRVTATLPADLPLTLGQDIDLFVEPNRILTFDANSGDRVECLPH
ncbi:ABC transporter ATP-binding protein [Tritonibacter scottomollicae]|uniref:ABC transporter ATP-binding protein n=1 Tax=Tritonibacter scottomollicae TaxID=483013 RepID=UPI003AA8D975